MASIFLHSHCTLPSLLHAKTSKPTPTQNLSFLSKSYQLHGIRLCTSSKISVPSSSTVKVSIFAKACAFRDSYEKFKKAGAEVVGVSGDASASHKAFAQKYKLPFTLLSDEGNKVRKEWGVPSDLFGALPRRQTYVLDKNGVFRLVYNNQFQPEKHIDETLKFLKSV